MLKTLRSVTLALALVLVGPGSAAVNSPDKLTVVLGRSISPNHAPLIVAAKRDLFAAQDLDVQLIVADDPDNPAKWVTADKADIALSHQYQLHLQVNQGLPLKRIATLIATPLSSLIVLNESPIRSTADLKGRKIGYSGGDFEETLLKAMLAQHAIAPDQVSLAKINTSRLPALISGQVDAVIGVFRNLELNQLAILKKPGRAFYVEEEGIPAYDELILVANRTKLNDPRLRRFLMAVEQAVHYIVNHPDEAWALFSSYDQALDNELNRRAWPETWPRFALRPAALDNGRYQRFAQFLVQYELLTVVLPVSNYAVELSD